MIIFVLGIILITIGYTHNIKEVCYPKVEYRYIHKNMYDDLIYNSNLKETIWKDMNQDDFKHTYQAIKPSNEFNNFNMVH